jgi:NADPH:quinone reductase-like Zn-dependent oxidoreductase
MKVIAIKEFGGVENFFEAERDIPKPGPQEVLIRVRAGSFNQADYKIRQGRYGGSLPLVLGHDAAGIIEAVGKDVNRLRIGDEVWAYLGGPCSNGAYAEYVSLPHDFVTVRPRTLSAEEAASVPVCGLTANQSIRLKAKPTPNHSVFITGGSGGLGSAAIQILQMIGVQKIVTTSGREASKQFIVDQLRLGPEQIVHYPGKGLKQLTEEAMAANGGNPFDKTFDFVGGEMKRLCFELVDFDGDIVSTVPEIDPFAVPVWHGKASPLFRRSASLHFHWLAAAALFGSKEHWHRYTQELQELTFLYEAERLWPIRVQNLGPLSVETIRYGHERLEAGGIQGKMIFTVP